MSSIMVKYLDKLLNLNAPKLKRATEGGNMRRMSEIAVDVQDTVSSKARDFLFPEAFDTLENIAIQHNIPVRIAGKGNSTLVNVGARTILVGEKESKQAFTNEVLDFAYDSARSMKLAK